MDPDESPETCAIRELKEETGYIGEVVADRSFQVTPVMFNGKSVTHRRPRSVLPQSCVYLHISL